MTDTLRVAQQDRETLQYLLDGLPDDPLTFTMERGALQRALARLAPPAPGGEREDGEREPADGEIYGVRFGMGAVGVSTGVYTGEPAVILREPSVPGVIGMPFTDAERGPIRAVLLFPTEAQAKAVADALTIPPAEAREPVGDVELRQQRDAAEQRAATLSRMLEERTFPSVEVTDAMVERGLRWYWPHDMKYADNQRDFMRRFLEAALAQPRDTPRDSGDAELRAANKLAAAAMTTGGVAGADPHLQEAIDAFIAARDAAMQSPTGEPT